MQSNYRVLMAKKNRRFTILLYIPSCFPGEITFWTLWTTKRLGRFIIESKIIMDKSFLFMFAVSKLGHVSDWNSPTAKAPQTHPTEPTGTGTAAKGISKPQSIQSVFSSTRKHWIQRIRRIGARRTGNCRQLSIFVRLYFVVDVLVCLSVFFFRGQGYPLAVREKNIAKIPCELK